MGGSLSGRESSGLLRGSRFHYAVAGPTSLVCCRSLLATLFRCWPPSAALHDAERGRSSVRSYSSVARAPSWYSRALAVNLPRRRSLPGTKTSRRKNTRPSFVFPTHVWSAIILACLLRCLTPPCRVCRPVDHCWRLFFLLGRRVSPLPRFVFSVVLWTPGYIYFPLSPLLFVFYLASSGVSPLFVSPSVRVLVVVYPPG